MRRKKKESDHNEEACIGLTISKGNSSMPHCSKCGKMPPLGLKRLFKAVGRLLQSLLKSISTWARVTINYSKKSDKK